MPLFPWFKHPAKRSSDDPEIHAYLTQFKSGIPKGKPVRDLSFVVLDTETDGLNPAKDAILSLACYRINGMTLDLSDRFDRMIRRNGYQAGAHTRIHGIMAKHTAAGAPERDTLLAFLDFIGNHILVGHHISFDIRFLNQALQQHFNIKLMNKSLDTARLASRLEKPVMENTSVESLDALCARYNVAPLQRHTAAGDAYMTALLFMKLLSRLEKRGVASYRDLMR